MNDKVVYIITTFKCSACKCIEYILKEIQKDNPTFIIETIDFKNVPEWININVKLTDFPTVIFVKDNVIKYYFTGTFSKKKIIQLMNSIDF